MARNWWWVGIVFGLAACGGGGGGGGSSDGRGGAVSIPQTATPLPGITYQGVDGAANLSAANAGALAEATRGAFQVTMALADEITSLPLGSGETVNRTEAGPGGGTVQLTGRTQADGTGWVLATYSGYRDGNSTVNGRELLELLQAATPANGQLWRYRLSLADFRVQEPDFDVTYDATLTRDEVGGTVGRTVTGSLQIRDRVRNVALYAQNVNLTRTSPNDGAYLALSGSARAYDSRYGYLDVQSEAPWHFRYDEEYPHHGGALRGVGLGGRYLRLEPLTPTTAAVEFVGPNATQPNYSVRLNWEDDFEQETTRQAQDAPLADGGSSLIDVPGTMVTLDSRFSSHPQNAFLSSQWQLLFRPPGSTAELDVTAAAQPKITMDLPGRYVLRVEVSDGVRSDSDVIALTADPTQYISYAPVKSQLTADEVSASGSLWFDLSRTQYTSFDEPSPQLTLSGVGPSGGYLQPQRTGQSATVSLPSPGVYEFMWSLGGPSLASRRVLDLKWVAYGTRMLFAPAGTAYLGTSSESATGLSSGDLNGDGRIDLALTTSSAGGAAVQVFYNNPTGLLSAATSIPIQEMNRVEIADVTGDGIPDLVLRDSSGISVVPQTTVGVFGAQQPIAGGCSAVDSQLAIADLNGDGRLDVVTLGCGGGLTYFLQSSGGQLQAGTAVATGTSTEAQFAAGDLNDDGVADVALVDRSNGTAPNVFVLYGVQNALPGAPVTLPFQASQNQRHAGPIAIGDMNGDGRIDVVTGNVPSSNGTTASQVQIFQRQADGSYAAPTALSAGQILTRLRVQDLDNDGQNDIAIGIGQTSLTVAYNNGFGSFSQFVPDLRPTAAGSGPAFPETAGDFNGDGRTDFAYITELNYRKVLAVVFGVEP